MAFRALELFAMGIRHTFRAIENLTNFLGRVFDASKSPTKTPEKESEPSKTLNQNRGKGFESSENYFRFLSEFCLYRIIIEQEQNT